MRRVMVACGLLLVAAMAFGGGASQRTQVGVAVDDTVYISPFSSPGVQDELTIPISVTTASGNRNVIIAYEIVIRDQQDRVVWIESAVDQSDQPGFFGRLFQNLGLAQRQTTVTIPSSTTWNGTFQGSTLGADGARVPDGEYTHVLTATLASEDVVSSDPRIVVVDNTPPTATAELDYLYFAPGSDVPGARQTVTLTQTTSEEVEWAGRVVSVDTGAEVFNVFWQGFAARDFVWDGRDIAGNPVPDGSYRYTLEGRDRAGNVGRIDPIIVVVDTADRPIVIESAMPGGGFAFSPNDSGVRDELLLSFGGLNVNTDLLDIVELSATGPVSGSVDITPAATAILPLTGYVDQERSQRAPEGEYELTVTARYLNGMVVSATATAILDVTPPVGGLAVSDSIFSPELPTGDGFKDTITVTHTISDDAEWVGEVYDHRSGALMESFVLDPVADRRIVWDGRDLAGNPIPDGTYRYRLVGTDPAGNRTETSFVQVTVDRRPTDVELVLSREYFSPNGDGQGDVVVIRPELSVPTGIAEYRFRIVDAQANEVLSFEGTGPLPAQFPWDGRNAAGQLLPEAQYFAALDLIYEKGNRPRAVSPPMTIDNTIPQVALRASSAILSPTGDGVNDIVEFIPFVEPIGEIVSFVGQIRALDGRVVAEITGDSPRGTAYWDGTTATGQRAPDGGYVGVLRVEHRNGTIREAQTGTIALSVDPTRPAVALRLMPQLFRPDGDGVADTVDMVIAVADGRPIASWTIRVVRPDGTEFYRRSGSDPVRSFEWDGRSATGELVRMATDYQVAYEITDGSGNVITGSETLTVDMLTEERFGMRRILIDDIVFEGYTTRYLNWNKELSERNVAALDQLAAALRKFPNYRIDMHGHAVSVLYYDAELSDLEHVQTLIPLSRGRTETILDALAARGIDRGRFTREWWGKLRPLIPFSDLDERFINRRVEFYLVR